MIGVNSALVEELESCTNIVKSRIIPEQSLQEHKQEVSFPEYF